MSLQSSLGAILKASSWQSSYLIISANLKIMKMFGNYPRFETRGNLRAFRNCYKAYSLVNDRAPALGMTEKRK